jgi:prepilin-type N-terminal cleavage/methylation domain-containing protein
MIQRIKAKRGLESGFTLIELLIAIVVVGVLAAVVIIGVGSLQNEGEESACKASADAAKAASVVYYANNNHAWPADIAVMDGDELVKAEGTTIVASTMTGDGWTVTMTAGSGGNGPTFACSYT